MITNIDVNNKFKDAEISGSIDEVTAQISFLISCLFLKLEKSKGLSSAVAKKTLKFLVDKSVDNVEKVRGGSD